MYVTIACTYIYTFLICSDTPNTREMLQVSNALALSGNEDKEDEPCSPHSMTSAQRCFYTATDKNTASILKVERCTYNIFLCMYVCMYLCTAHV